MDKTVQLDVPVEHGVREISVLFFESSYSSIPTLLDTLSKSIGTI